jgi:hypothetical protein
MRIEDIPPTKSMEYFLGAIHWLDALTPPLEKHLQHLVDTVKALLNVNAGEPAAREIDANSSPRFLAAGQKFARTGGSLRRAITIGCVVLALAGIVIVTLAVFGPDGWLQTSDQLQGTYVGTYTASQVPGEHQISVTFKQTGSTVVATFVTSLGGRGTGSGEIRGNAIGKMVSQSTLPNCPGTYTSSFLFSGDTVSWTYTGEDCLGSGGGHGLAKKKKPWFW